MKPTDRKYGTVGSRRSMKRKARSTVQFVGSKLKPKDSRREDLDDVIKELDRIEQIITGLLMFAKPPAASPQLCDVHEVLDKTLDMLEVQFQDANVELKRAFGENLPQVWVDPDLVQQVFLNLFLNAQDAMPSGGWLTIKTGNRGSGVSVEVSDTGQGISRDDVKRIYDPFFTTKKAGRSGTGLGLSITYGIVQEHSGHIGVHSVVGKGTRFRIELPAVESEVVSGKAVQGSAAGALE